MFAAIRFTCPLFFCLIIRRTAAAFISSRGEQQHNYVISRRHYKPSLLCATLTERQLQFWEDVEDGLDDIGEFWGKQGQSIDRIRTFGKRYVMLLIVILKAQSDS